MQAVMACLYSEDGPTRRDASNALVALATPGCCRTTGFNIPGLTHQNPEVRISTLGVLARIVTQGDGAAIAAMSACLDDENGSVATASAQSLVALMPSIDRSIIWDLSRRLDHKDGGIRKSAHDTLSRMVVTELPIVVKEQASKIDLHGSIDAGIDSQRGPQSHSHLDCVALLAGSRYIGEQMQTRAHGQPSNPVRIFSRACCMGFLTSWYSRK